MLFDIPAVQIYKHPQRQKNGDAIERNRQQVKCSPALHVLKDISDEVQQADKGQNSEEPLTV